MNPIKSIRDRLGVTQAELAQVLGKTQGNVAFYERGQGMPPEVAKRLIVFASQRGVPLSYDDIYGAPDVPAPVAQAEGQGVHHA